jgi:Ca-activated chloride channel family protein
VSVCLKPKNLLPMMKKTFLPLFAIALLSLALISPDPGSICGKIKDKTTNEDMPFATVQLFKQDSILVTSTTSDVNGDFCFKEIPQGSYKLSVSCVGYQKKISSIVLSQAAVSTTIMIEQGVQLDSVQVMENVSLNGIMSTAPGVSYNISGKTLKRKYRSNAYGFSTNKEAENFNTEEYSKIDDNEFKETKKDPLSTFSIDVDRASYSNVRRYITKSSLPPADAVRSEEMINYFKYDYPQPKDEHPFSISTEFSDCPWNSKHQLVLVGIQGKEYPVTAMPVNNLTFLIDVSGSMNSPDKLPLVKDGLRMLVEQMRPEDKVSIVVYAGAAGMVLPPTPGTKKEKIIAALDKLEAGGSTAGGEGIQLAYRIAKESFMTNGNNRVILATDGDFNVGVSSEGELIRMIEQKREEGVFLTVLGFGTGNYKDSKMEKLADKGNGNYSYVDNLLEAKKTFVKEMGGTLLTIAKDVKIQVEFNPAHVKGYRLIGYENRVLNAQDFNDDKKDAGELGAGHTVTALYEIIPAGSSEEIASVDPLKYQTAGTEPLSKFGSELLTIKFRYKLPKENTSKLITSVVPAQKKSLGEMSENCRFACAVAEFGMLLRGSKYWQDGNYQKVIDLAKASKGSDEDGYRAEFIRLVEMAELIKQ